MLVPVMWEGQECGTLSSEQRGLYTIFNAKISFSGVCRIQAVYERGSLWLGVPVPENDALLLRVSIPTSKIPGGKLLRGQLAAKPAGWEAWNGGRVGDVTLPPGRRNGNRFRFSWKPGEAIPCEELMCFFKYTGDGYMEIRLSKDGSPVE